MTTIKFRRDTSANWTSVNPIPAQGEPCYETDTGKLKIGNGSDNYVTLPYVSDGGGSSGDLPIATATTLGGIKVGNNLSITEDGTLSANAGSSGTTDYTQLENKPQINSVELTGNKTLNDLGIQPKGDYQPAGDYANAVHAHTIADVTNLQTTLDGKQAKITSTNKLSADLLKDGTTNKTVTATEKETWNNKQNILSDGNGTNVVDNKVDIYQGTGGIQGLNLYQNNGTITKNDDLSINFNNGACGYIFLENKGVNNDYEIVLHCNYLNSRGSASDSNINGVRCLQQAIVPTPGAVAKGECWFDTYDSPFRVVAVAADGQTQIKTVDTINYIKYVIKGTNLTTSYSSTGEAYTELYTIAISSTYYINVCIANSPWQNDIANKWTNTTLYSDSYILDKTTNTYLMKQGIANEGVAVATSTKYGLVLPDNSTIVSNNGVISIVNPSNMVTTDTDQTISGNKTFTKSITTASIYPTDEITFNSTSQTRYINNIDSISGGYHSQNGYLTFKGDTTLVGDNKLVLDGRAGGLKLTAASSANITCENDLIAPNIRTTANGTIKLAHPMNVASGLITLDNNYGQLSISSSLEGNNNLLGVTKGTTYALIDGDNITTKDKDGILHYYINSQNIDTTYMKWDNSTGKLKVDTAAVAHLAMPSNTKVNLTLGANNSTYTAPADGYFSITAQLTENNGSVAMFSDDIYSYAFNPYKSAWFGTHIPVKKNGVMTIQHQNINPAVFVFSYAVGSVPTNTEPDFG